MGVTVQLKLYSEVTHLFRKGANSKAFSNVQSHVLFFLRLGVSENTVFSDSRKRSIRGHSTRKCRLLSHSPAVLCTSRNDAVKVTSVQCKRYLQNLKCTFASWT